MGILTGGRGLLLLRGQRRDVLPAPLTKLAQDVLALLRVLLLVEGLEVVQVRELRSRRRGLRDDRTWGGHRRRGSGSPGRGPIIRRSPSGRRRRHRGQDTGVLLHRELRGGVQLLAGVAHDHALHDANILRPVRLDQGGPVARQLGRLPGLLLDFELLAERLLLLADLLDRTRLLGLLRRRGLLLRFELRGGLLLLLDLGFGVQPGLPLRLELALKLLHTQHVGHRAGDLNIGRCRRGRRCRRRGGTGRRGGVLRVEGGQEGDREGDEGGDGAGHANLLRTNNEL